MSAFGPAARPNLVAATRSRRKFDAVHDGRYASLALASGILLHPARGFGICALHYGCRLRSSRHASSPDWSGSPLRAPRWHKSAMSATRSFATAHVGISRLGPIGAATARRGTPARTAATTRPPASRGNISDGTAPVPPFPPCRYAGRANIWIAVGGPASTSFSERRTPRTPSTPIGRFQSPRRRRREETSANA